MEMEVEQRKLDLEEKRIDQATDLAQIEVNKVEAASSSVFVSGWRPAIGWIGVAAMGYQFLAYPLFQWTYVSFRIHFTSPLLSDLNLWKNQYPKSTRV
jgi:hypothetical protein